MLQVSIIPVINYGRIKFINLIKIYRENKEICRYLAKIIVGGKLRNLRVAVSFIREINGIENWFYPITAQHLRGNRTNGQSRAHFWTQTLIKSYNGLIFFFFFSLKKTNVKGVSYAFSILIKRRKQERHFFLLVVWFSLILCL